MITLGAKLYFGLAAVALLAAMVLGLASGGSVLGVATFAWAGPVGDQFGYTVLVGFAAVSFFLGVVVTAFRDADAEVVVEVAGTETLPEAVPPAHLSPWPIVAAFGVTLLAIGLVFDAAFAGIGVVLLAAAAIEWTVTDWSDRATGDPAANQALRNRIMAPIETPAASLLGVLLFVFLASRVLLAVSKWGAIAVFALGGILILGVATLVASRPALNRSTVTALLLVGALALVGGGIAGLAAGEREFHYLGPDGDNGHHDDADEPDGDAEQATDDDDTAGDTEE
jgi:hypothetical protein